MTKPRNSRTAKASVSSKAAELCKVNSPKFDAAQEALLSAVVEMVGEDAHFADFENTMLNISNEVARRVAKKKSRP